MLMPRIRMSSYSREIHTGKCVFLSFMIYIYLDYIFDIILWMTETVNCVRLNLFSNLVFYRVLQHPNILQCLGQCVEAIPFLLVFEYCEMVSDHMQNAQSKHH